MSENPYVAPGADSPSDGEPKKKNSLLVYILAGCGGVTLLGFLLSIIIIAALTILGNNLSQRFEMVASAIETEDVERDQ